MERACVPKLFNSGVDDSGALLANGQVDPHYRITASADANFPGPDAFALLPGFPVGPWIDEGPNSRWIAPQASQATGNAPGIYNTGLSDSRVVLNDGLVDPHYKLVLNPSAPGSSNSPVQDLTLFPIVY